MTLSRGFRTPSYLREIHILVVDNDRQTLALMSVVLRRLGFLHVLEAKDGFEAAELMCQEEVDLVITDWEIKPLHADNTGDIPPNPVVRSDRWQPVTPKDGACLAKYIRHSPYSTNPYVPVIMMIGLGLKNHVEYARDAGVNEIVLKPLSIEALCRRIAMIIDSPRLFVVSEQYKGPCRRVENLPCDVERRRHDIRIFKHVATG